jgi:hypothetical protein
MKLRDVEYSKFSQNGEDGIIDHLVERLVACENRFLEIGCGNGKENNTTNLVELGWCGRVYDAKQKRIDEYKARKFKRVEAECLWVNSDIAGTIVRQEHVDVFSLDIDSTDWHVMRAMLCKGFAPSIAVLEYNATFMDRSVTVPTRMRHALKDIYYGASVSAWCRLMVAYGYKFVTVDSKGVNAFFLKDGAGTHEIDGVEWADNANARERFGPAPERFELIKSFPLEVV